MSKVLVTEYSLESIADAIRAKNGTQNTYKPGQMAAAIAAIPNVYAAGDEGKVVSNGALVQQTSRSVTENGTFDTTLNNEVTVNIPGTGTLETLTVTQNGIYTPGTGVAGFSQVDVNVSSANPMLNFDFTKSFTDTVKGYTAGVSNVTIGDNGAIFSGSTGRISIPSYTGLLTYEIEVGELKRGSSHTRFLMYSYDSGFIYRSYGYWTFYRGEWDTVQITDFNFFNNSTVKLVVLSNYVWQIYRNNELVLTSQGPCKSTNAYYNGFYIGSTEGNSLANGSTIKSLKVL